MDEIGEMAFELQAKLLRVLEAGEYIKIGDTKPTKVNVRVISATNRDLKKEIEQGNFREDLYYRLSVFRYTSLLFVSAKKTSNFWREALSNSFQKTGETSGRDGSGVLECFESCRLERKYP